MRKLLALAFLLSLTSLANAGAFTPPNGSLCFAYTNSAGTTTTACSTLSDANAAIYSSWCNQTFGVSTGKTCLVALLGEFNVNLTARVLNYQQFQAATPITLGAPN